MDQTVVDIIVERCREVVRTYGGQSDELLEVRKYYQMFHVHPDAFAYVLLDESLKKVEEQECTEK